MEKENETPGVRVPEKLNIDIEPRRSARLIQKLHGPVRTDKMIWSAREQASPVGQLKQSIRLHRRR
jgi:hypothetical protein